MTLAPTANDEIDLLRLRTCPQCEYSLEGLPEEGICPECGRGYDQSVIIVRCQGPGAGRMSIAALGLLTVVLVAIAAAIVWRGVHRPFVQPLVMVCFVLFMLATAWIDKLFSPRKGDWLLWIAPAGIGVQREFDPNSPMAKIRRWAFVLWFPLYMACGMIPAIIDSWLVLVPIGCFIFALAFTMWFQRKVLSKLAVKARGVQPDLIAWAGLDRFRLRPWRKGGYQLLANNNTKWSRHRMIDVSMNVSPAMAEQLRETIERFSGKKVDA